jgi:hypothetical protein
MTIPPPPLAHGREHGGPRPVVPGNQGRQRIVAPTLIRADYRGTSERVSGGIPLWDSALARPVAGTPSACI